MSTPVVFDMFRDTYTPLVGTFDSQWVTPGRCATAQCVVFRVDDMQKITVERAHWRLCWNPNINTGTNVTGVRLVSFYSGNPSLNMLQYFTCSNYTNPKNDAIDITSQVQALISQAIIDNQVLEFIHQTYGDGTTGPLIYSSALEMRFG